MNADLPLPPPELRQFLMYESSEERWLYWSKHALELLVNEGRLAPDGRILDMGCGAGRTAASLTRHLSASGSYEGADACLKAIQWCQGNIASLFPNFRFTHVDVRNSHYNPSGIFRAAEFNFPYDGASFDTVYLGSVFTHMEPGGVIRYFSEIRRVLRPGGRVVATFFMITPQALASGSPQRQFRIDHGTWRSTSLTSPEDGTAYSEAFVRKAIEDTGLRLVEPVRPGAWWGAIVAGGDFQDTLTVERGM